MYPKIASITGPVTTTQRVTTARVERRTSVAMGQRSYQAGHRRLALSGQYQRGRVPRIFQGVAQHLQ